jgi:hypothetical protein
MSVMGLYMFLLLSALLITGCHPHLGGVRDTSWSPAKTDERGNTFGISQYGITWTFDREYAHGRFINGDYWVVGPVTIARIDPPSKRYLIPPYHGVTERVMHGAMVNPMPAGEGSEYRQGYDSLMYYMHLGTDIGVAYSDDVNAALDVSVTNPLILQPGSSLVSYMSKSDIHSLDPNLNDVAVKTAAVLTVLDQVPPEGSFRPPYAGKNKTIKYNKKQLRWELLKRLPRVANTPGMAEVTQKFERPWIDHIPGWPGRFQHPEDNMPDYGRELVDLVGYGSLMLNLDFTDEEKETLLYGYVQVGIDLWGIVTGGGAHNWPDHGGSNYGRKWPILFAAMMLNDPEMKKVGYMDSSFSEDTQTFFVDEPLAGTRGYGVEDIGLPDWRDGPDFSDKDDKDWFSNGHRLCCSANAWWGQILSAYIMDARALWNHEALFDYQDRFEAENLARGITDWRMHWSDFPYAMWNAYRDDYGPRWIPAKKGQKKCSDGTSYGQCSVNKPKYCDEGLLIDDCQRCGCPPGQTCQADGRCSVPCVSHDHFACYDGDVYWYDSCNKREEKKEECGTNGCLDGRCVEGATESRQVQSVTVSDVTVSSAKIRWTTPTKSDSMVRYGYATDYDKQVHWDEAVIHHEVTLTSLAGGTTYHFRVESRTGSIAYFSKDYAFTTKTANVMIGKNKEFLCDGKPFFPLMQWLQSEHRIPYQSTLGINTFFAHEPWDGKSYCDTAQRYGAWCILQIGQNNAPQDHPALFAWYPLDEPDMHGRRPDWLLNEYNKLKSSRPKDLLITTVTSRFFSRFDPFDWMGGSKHWYAQYANATDIYGFDHYPVYGWCRPDWIHDISDAEEEFVKKYAGESPTYIAIEAAKTSGQWCENKDRGKNDGPYPHETRNEVWQAIIHGAKAIAYFTHSWQCPGYTQWCVTPEIESEIKRTNEQITRLTEAILARDYPRKVTEKELKGGRVDTLVKKYENYIYIFAVNVLRRGERVRFTIDGPRSNIVEVVDEGRTINLTGNSFTDHFEELGVHIYRIQANP